jgi:1-deoxy-D-xylulose-5-phosphate synthase
VVGDRAGVKVHTRELLGDQEQQVAALELLQPASEIEVIKHLSRIARELRDVVLQVGASAGGGFGEKIARYYGNSEMRVLNYGLRKEFADRYNLDELMKANRLTDKQMAEDIAGILE